jgi:leucyl-tRNA synthetase
MRQWVLKITDYADRLLNDLDAKGGIPLITKSIGEDAFRTNEPVSERQAAVFIVKHWAENKYLCSRWKATGWQGFHIGGIEPGESLADTASRELLEETGYKNARFVREIGRVDARFYQVVKKQNRLAHFTGVYLELKDGVREEVAQEEKNLQDQLWLTAAEVEKFLNHPDMVYLWDLFTGAKKQETKPLLDWPEAIKESQRNWIGRSEGSLLKFKVKLAKASEATNEIEVFTTRPDTLFGVTYVVLAPEHKLVNELLPTVSNKAEVAAYISNAARETEIERTDAKKEKTGVELKGVKAINPANGEEVPVWISDYVLADYGTGAVMAVPAHDERDWAFAKKFGLQIKQVIAPYFTKTEGKDHVEPNKETITRKTAYALLFDEKNDRFLCLDWEKFDWHSGIIGGVDEGESYREAAIREIKEETGYADIEFIKDLGMIMHNHFFATHKDVNRYAIGQCMLFKLKSLNTVPTKEEETKNHKTVWVKRSEMEKWLNLVAFKYAWEMYLSGTECFTGNGKLMNSGKFDGKDSEAVMKEITEAVGGKLVTKYKLRDWVFSRQRYWGEPIPLIHCEKCGVVAVPEKDLPVKLPKVESYEPTGTGESPLASIAKWVNVKCPACGGKGKRETNTMPQWAGSSWYYLRYMDPGNSKKLVDPKKEKYWAPVDLYVGGAEHATRHLIYARFWHKFLYDIGVVSTIEPFAKLQSVGLIMGEDGRKMSKRFGNVVNPDQIVGTYGADTLRLYEMFMGPFDQAIPWSTDSIIGARRFIERVWKLTEKMSSGETLGLNEKLIKSTKSVDQTIHRTIKKVTEDIDNLRFNTAISTMMIAANELEKAPAVSREHFESYLKLLAPFAPHATEELWSALGNKKSIHVSEWPTYDPAMLESAEATIIIQVNGKVRGSFKAPTGTGKEQLEQMAKDSPEAKKWLENKAVKRVIAVPDRLVNIVVI